MKLPDRDRIAESQSTRNLRQKAIEAIHVDPKPYWSKEEIAYYKRVRRELAKSLGLK